MSSEYSLQILYSAENKREKDMGKLTILLLLMKLWTSEGNSNERVHIMRRRGRHNTKCVIKLIAIDIRYKLAFVA